MSDSGTWRLESACPSGRLILAPRCFSACLRPAPRVRGEGGVVEGRPVLPVGAPRLPPMRSLCLYTMCTRAFRSRLPVRVSAAASPLGVRSAPRRFWRYSLSCGSPPRRVWPEFVSRAPRLGASPDRWIALVEASTRLVMRVRPGWCVCPWWPPPSRRVRCVHGRRDAVVAFGFAPSSGFVRWSCVIVRLARVRACPPQGSYLVDPASSHMLVSKIKPCMSKYKLLYTVKLRMAH